MRVPDVHDGALWWWCRYVPGVGRGGYGMVGSGYLLQGTGFDLWTGLG